MLEMIFRLSDQASDAEIYINDAGKNKGYFKAIKIEDLMKKMKSAFSTESTTDYKKDIVVIDKELIALSPNCIVTKQKERKRIAVYAGKAYKIVYPNSIYVICHQANEIKSIEAYCFKAEKGMETELYRYPMPNMFSDNRICMGSANKRIDVREYKEALEEILCTQYTHAKPDNIKGFDTTSEYFDYLAKNEFPYDKLYRTGKKLKDILIKGENKK
jgi:hypothetical protein